MPDQTPLEEQNIDSFKDEDFKEYIDKIITQARLNERKKVIEEVEAEMPKEKKTKWESGSIGELLGGTREEGYNIALSQVLTTLNNMKDINQ